ncbi:flagellar motor protein MotS [Sutcliffiella cohnii]|uniref:flagellar motor protein MotS n=1 Tax=Sutcliffiella TaxID=2837511 RepID=UPI0022DE9433|nr:MULTISPECIES: flagellar motor protein MotS [Sutcliffiella]MED4016165.1 flagellar motor protein MotS [Sutcliffiella cohnii]WBL14136.1 flagellar motor protein MotS [Sutcliffiella sp. NC1]
MSKFRKLKKTDDKGAPRWMVTFSDLFMLILVFFILLFSMSQIDLVKFKAVAESFKQVNLLDYHPSAIPFEHPTDFSIDYESTNNNNSNYGEEQSEDQLEEVLREVQQFLDENDLEDIVVANRTERGVVLVLEEQILFNSGEASILPVAFPFLNKLGNLLERIPNLVKIEGHTDTVPMNNYQYPSNWELSTARASSVIRYLIDEHDLNAERFIAVGYGETRPIVPNTTRENMQKNRRVEIVISDPASVEEIDY